MCEPPSLDPSSFLWLDKLNQLLSNGTKFGIKKEQLSLQYWGRGRGKDGYLRLKLVLSCDINWSLFSFPWNLSTSSQKQAEMEVLVAIWVVPWNCFGDLWKGAEFLLFDLVHNCTSHLLGLVSFKVIIWCLTVWLAACVRFASGPSFVWHLPILTERTETW